jgi:hypothetical protein
MNITPDHDGRFCLVSSPNVLACLEAWVSRSLRRQRTILEKSNAAVMSVLYCKVSLESERRRSGESLTLRVGLPDVDCFAPASARTV